MVSARRRDPGKQHPPGDCRSGARCRPPTMKMPEPIIEPCRASSRPARPRPFTRPAFTSTRFSHPSSVRKRASYGARFGQKAARSRRPESAPASRNGQRRSVRDSTDRHQRLRRQPAQVPQAVDADHGSGLALEAFRDRAEWRDSRPAPPRPPKAVRRCAWKTRMTGVRANESCGRRRAEDLPGPDAPPRRQRRDVGPGRRR